MFSNVGFFRFVADYNKPIESLESAIKAHGDVGGSLIVLPEAFNIGKYYRDQGECDYSRKILDRLQVVAQSFDVALVAGLIVKELDGPMPPYSSGYLIDGSGAILICRKHGPDFCGAPPLTPENVRTQWNTPISERVRLCNYTPFGGVSNIPNPICYRDSAIAAVICMDGNNEQLSGPVKEGLSKLADPGIVCIPACMDKNWIEEAIAGTWPQHYVILANSDPNGIRSFISKDGTITKRDNREYKNTIVLCAP